MHPDPRIRSRAYALLQLLLLLAAAVPARADGRIAPGLAWCGGVSDPAELSACRAAGFTAVRVDVPWQAAPSWDALDRFVAAAQAQELGVILSLQAAAPPTDALPVDPDNPAYAAGAKLWLERVVEHFRGNAAVIGWMMPDEPEAALHPSEAGFRAFVAALYKDVAALNQAWGARYNAFPEVSAAGVQYVARQQPLGICRAAMDLAAYRQSCFVRLLRLWARLLRTSEENRPLFTGAMARYRCLISVPEEYDAVVVRMMPGGQREGELAEEGVAIAQRSGRFAAIAMLPAWDLLGGLGAALLQGATGVAVEDWRLLRVNAELRGALRAALAGWRKSGAFNTVPRPTTAILYEPFGENPANPSPFGIGYLSGTNTGELEPLFATFRHGTAFGQVGFLGREDLTGDRLSHYRVLLCPMALSLNSDEIRALFRFAEGGGVVVADMGVGSYEAGGSVLSWSVELATLLGYRTLWAPVPGTGSLRVYEQSPLFPSLRAGAASASPVRGPQTFSDLAVLMEPVEGSIAFAAVVDRTAPGKRTFGGLLVHPVGKGWVVFASMKLWQQWTPADPLFQLFHRDLMSRSPRVAVSDALFLGGDTQVAAFEGGLAVRNVGDRPRVATIATPGQLLYAGQCINFCRQAVDEGGTVVETGLRRNTLGLYERVPIHCVVTRGVLGVAVEEYGPEGIKISVCGGAARTGLSRQGTATMKPAMPVPAHLLIGDGRYPLRPGSVHLLRVKELDTGKVQERRVQIGQDGKLDLGKAFYADVIAITPVAK